MQASAIHCPHESAMIFIERINLANLYTIYWLLFRVVMIITGATPSHCFKLSETISKLWVTVILFVNCKPVVSLRSAALLLQCKRSSNSVASVEQWCSWPDYCRSLSSLDRDLEWCSTRGQPFVVAVVVDVVASAHCPSGDLVLSWTKYQSPLYQKWSTLRTYMLEKQK